MKLDLEILAGDPIVFSGAEQPWGRTLTDEFRMDRVAFDNPLHTAVARAGAIDNDTGELDRRVVSAVNQTAEYLEGHRGEPFVLAETFRVEDNTATIISGFIGIVAVEGEVIVTDTSVGVRCSEPSAEFYGSRPPAFESGERQRLMLNGPHMMHGAHVPFVTQSTSFGVSREVSENENTHEVVAGEEIPEWITNATISPTDAYELYKLVAYGLTRGEAAQQGVLDCLLQEPFTTLIRQENQAHADIRNVLTRHGRRLGNLRAMIDGEDAAANLALEEIEERYPDLVFPNTVHGDRVKVTAPVNDPTNRASLEERLARLDERASATQALRSRISQ